MAAWKTNTTASPANARKRLQAALDALDGALELAERHPDPAFAKRLRAPIQNAAGWTRDAIKRTRSRAR